MGTQSTVKFKNETGHIILSVYQHYDGYVQGVGAQVATTLKRWVVEGVTTTEYNTYLKKDITRTNKANGVEDLALLYIADNKKDAYNMFVTHEGDSKEFDYVVEKTHEGYFVSVYEEFYKDDDAEYVPKLKYKGDIHEFISYVEELTGEAL